MEVQVSIYHASEVYRVSWLKAKARYDRWNEEFQMVQAEMFWTTLWFKHQGKEGSYRLVNWGIIHILQSSRISGKGSERRLKRVFRGKWQ